MRPITVTIFTMRPLLLAAALMLPPAAPARAADLAAHSRIGALFAEPAPARRAVVVARPKPVEEAIVAYAPEIDVRPVVGGYYGKPNAYYYRSYYNTSPELIFSRAPYACGSYGYC